MCTYTVKKQKCNFFLNSQMESLMVLKHFVISRYFYNLNFKYVQIHS